MALGFAPGRVCLLGEHGDWAGGPEAACLVAPLSAGIEANARALDWGLVIHSDYGVSRLDGAGRCLADDPNRYVAAVARELVRRGHALRPARIVLRASLPAGRGFSSSAAVCVASARALAGLSRLELTDGELADIAYAAEAGDLGVNCGRMDPLACAVGQPLHIDWGTGGSRRLTRDLHLVAAAFPGEVRAEPILAELRRQVPRAAIQAWGRAATEGAAALESNDLGSLGKLMQQAQAVYEGLPHPALRAPGLKRACAEAVAAGALGAKFTGAGGDRSLVALYGSEDERLSGERVLAGLGLTVVR
jgi:galactokinase